MSRSRPECRNVRVIVTRLAPDLVRVAVVEDTFRVLPGRRTAIATDTDGRGLAIVETVADRWEVDLLRWGKRACAEQCTDSGKRLHLSWGQVTVTAITETSSPRLTSEP